MQKLVFEVQYWGGWGYGRFFKSLRDFLYSQPDIANRIQVVERMDRMTTGNFGTLVGWLDDIAPLHESNQCCLWKSDHFTTCIDAEITVPATGQVLHSKKSGKGGKCSTDEERYELLDKIQSILCDMME